MAVDPASSVDSGLPVLDKLAPHQPVRSPQPAPPSLRHGPSARAWRSAHEKLKADDDLWASLFFEGIQQDGVGGLLEHRRCPGCGSTLSRRTNALDAVSIVASLSGIHSRSLEAIVNAGEAVQRVE